MFEGTEVFYKTGRCFWRKYCLRKNWNIAAAHAIEYKDVVVYNAEAAEDLGQGERALLGDAARRTKFFAVRENKADVVKLDNIG